MLKIVTLYWLLLLTVLLGIAITGLSNLASDLESLTQKHYLLDKRQWVCARRAMPADRCLQYKPAKERRHAP